MHNRMNKITNGRGHTWKDAMPRVTNQGHYRRAWREITVALIARTGRVFRIKEKSEKMTSDASLRLTCLATQIIKPQHCVKAGRKLQSRKVLNVFSYLSQNAHHRLPRSRVKPELLLAGWPYVPAIKWKERSQKEVE